MNIWLSPTIADGWPCRTGLIRRKVARQIREIDKLNDKFKSFTILKGIEVDILKDGRLDLPDSTLAKLDVVVASVHSFFDLPREAQTERDGPRDAEPSCSNYRPSNWPSHWRARTL